MGRFQLILEGWKETAAVSMESLHFLTWEYSQGYIVHHISKITHSFGPGSHLWGVGGRWNLKTGGLADQHEDLVLAPKVFLGELVLDEGWQEASLLGVGSAVDPEWAGTTGAGCPWRPPALHPEPAAVAWCQGWVSGKMLAWGRRARVGGLSLPLRRQGFYAWGGSWTWADCRASLRNWIAGIEASGPKVKEGWGNKKWACAHATYTRLNKHSLTYVLTQLFSFLVSGLEMISCLCFLELSGLRGVLGCILASMTSMDCCV